MKVIGCGSCVCLSVFACDVVLDKNCKGFYYLLCVKSSYTPCGMTIAKFDDAKEAWSVKEKLDGLIAVNGDSDYCYLYSESERGFVAMPDLTLLNHLLCLGYDVPGAYLRAMNNIKKLKEEMAYLEGRPEEADPERLSFIDDDIAYWEEKLEIMREGWRPGEKPDMVEEIDLIKKWVKVRKILWIGDDDDDE